MKMHILAASMVAIGISAGVAIAQSNEPIQPIRPPSQINVGLVELGKKLYFCLLYTSDAADE